MMIVTKFLRSCCGQATVDGNSLRPGRPLPASMAGRSMAGHLIRRHRRDLISRAPISCLTEVCYPSVGSTEGLSIKRREFIALLGGVVRLTTHAAPNAKSLIRTSRSDRPRHQPCDPE